MVNGQRKNNLVIPSAMLRNNFKPFQALRFISRGKAIITIVDANETYQVLLVADYC